MRGEFHRADGLVIPNNVTSFGAKWLLTQIFNPTGASLYMGLCSAVYDPNLTTDDIQEPSFANGYVRVGMPRDTDNWVIPGQVNGEWYAESLPVVFAATDAGFDVTATRLFLTDGPISTNVIALGGALPADLRVTPATPLPDRTFKYRLYLR